MLVTATVTASNANATHTITGRTEGLQCAVDGPCISLQTATVLSQYGISVPNSPIVELLRKKGML